MQMLGKNLQEYLFSHFSLSTCTSELKMSIKIQLYYNAKKFQKSSSNTLLLMQIKSSGHCLQQEFGFLVYYSLLELG